MAVTEDALQEKRERNEEARLELKRINDERLNAELNAATEQQADELDAEYERIQAAIEQAKALNAKATDKPVEEKVAVAASPTTPPKPETPAPATVNAEGK